jgi:hypothetical protein
VLQSSRDKDKIRRIRAEIAEQHESIMELICECAIRFNGLHKTSTQHSRRASTCHSKSISEHTTASVIESG